MEDNIRLTSLSKGSGCGCKIAPAVLQEILSSSGKTGNFSALVGGYESNDDAIVWDNGDGNYLLATTDFFTPIVDDAFDFGRIAATNAISDIYAMGGKPLFAMAILAFPLDKLPANVASQIIAGARAVCDKAGIPLAGGHSIDIPVPVFGLAVNGMVKKENLRKNSSAIKGDYIFLTKSIGSGIISAALKRNVAKEEHVKHAIEAMTTLNTIGSALAEIKSVHAMTDVTGFGLIGHLSEMCEGSGLSAEINFQNIPLIEGTQQYIDQFIFPDNTYRNWNAYEKTTSGINGPEFIALNDPQTSGGILFTVGEEGVEEVVAVLEKAGLDKHKAPIGRMVERRGSVLVAVD